MNRRLLFAFLFALLLPFTQVAAAVHEASHLKSAPASIACDQCTLGAAVTGGAAVSAPPVIVALEAPHVAPATPVVPVRANEPFTAFSSRAPPASH